ncbi:regulatory protein, luxR family [Xaviernesmea oryzae]|uniref:Regulatory protein, luxR family n=1 Tax=Xaviernesmea oryzae TaxID=464029 RepID=A0A1X7EKR9_9HYPH|nr:LuxR C-terminal-related transcriptional regulator [Xaviernesmea oryzae]SMF35613.1 regulatory protein, luxR family [Xaviernesmea oryzae]
MYLTKESEHLVSDTEKQKLIRGLRKLAEDLERGMIPLENLPCLISLSEKDRDGVHAICILSPSQVEASLRAKELLSSLTPRQVAILDRILAGKSAKIIAYELGVSQRTVENHIGTIHRKARTRRLPELLALVYARLP